MLIDGGFMAKYLNYKTKEIVPFLKKLTPKDKKEVVALLKKQTNKKGDCNTISVWAALVGYKAGNEYKRRRSGYYSIPADVVDPLPETYVPVWIGKFGNHKDVPENTYFLYYLFNFYQGVYHDNLIRILYRVPYFSDLVFAKKHKNKVLNTDCQYDIKNINVWMKTNISFQSVHYLFLFSTLFNKYKTLCGTAFEVIISKVVSYDFKIQNLETIIDKKISFQWTSVKNTDGLWNLINLIVSNKSGFKKLLMPILSAVEKSVFNLKRLLEPDHELLNQNQSKANNTVLGLLIEWKKENNLKTILSN
ncbi:DUF7825 domain-containing protein [Chryseobacterium viscerum]|uniref:DUF7825 domain-containing protein n=1 Tax=Chryseobacterium viscerum TaxID=1037377 RepID=A0A5N4BMU9_9FLAO|nr:DUF6493 family protein [Chryseobacterium viscerum]KAB1229730.1 hypothetical protein F8D52_15670 [Chryseobacterium viscerum]